MAEKIVRVKSWDELPEVLEPGEYKVNGVIIRVREPTEKEELMMFVRGVKKLADEAYD